MKTKIISWIKSLDKITVLTVLIIWLLAGAFYWFQLRPIKIRTVCDDAGKTGAAKHNNASKAYDFYYAQCLHNSGLK